MNTKSILFAAAFAVLFNIGGCNKQRTSKNPIIRLPAADQARLVGMKARGGR